MARFRLEAARRRAGAESGFALTELLVGSVMALVMIGACITLFTTSLGAEPRTASRAAQMNDARTFAESVSRELRQAWAVPVATAGQLSVLTFVKRATCAGTAAGPSIPCRVTYACASGACTRVVANADGTGASAPAKVVDGLSSANVFTYAPSAAAPTFIGINLALAATGSEDAITLEDGVALRNESPPAAPEA